MAYEVVVMVVPKIILMEVAQIIPLPLNLEEDVYLKKHTHLYEQFKQGMTVMSNLLSDLL